MLRYRVYYRRGNPPFFKPITILIYITVIIINSVNSRSIDYDDNNLTIDRSEVPARYVFEIDEVRDELSKIYQTSSPQSQGNLNSSLMFNMPIAVAVFCAVIFLVCCFCCLRCAVTYDGIKRNGFYERSEKSHVADIVKRLNSTMKEEPKNEKY